MPLQNQTFLQVDNVMCTGVRCGPAEVANWIQDLGYLAAKALVRAGVSCDKSMLIALQTSRGQVQSGICRNIDVNKKMSVSNFIIYVNLKKWKPSFQQNNNVMNRLLNSS